MTKSKIQINLGKSKSGKKLQFAIYADLSFLRFICHLSFVIWIYFSNCAAYADPFLESALKDGIGARPLGMGGTFTALCDDSNAVYYNPAGLAQIGTLLAKEYMDMNADYYRINEGFTMSTNQTGIAYWKKLDKDSQTADITAVSYGILGTSGVSWGFTLKNISWSSKNSSGRGGSLDVGLKAPMLSNLTGGVLLQDFLKNNIDISSSIRIGILFTPSLIRDSNIIVDSELRNLKSPSGATILMHYGAETKLSEGLILRGGWEKDHFTAGASFTIPYSNMDYAVIINRDSKNIHMFNFRFSERK